MNASSPHSDFVIIYGKEKTNIESYLLDAHQNNYLYSNDIKRDQREEWDRKNIRTELESDEMLNEVAK